MGNRHPLYAPHGHFRCRGEENWVALSVQTERQWQRLVAAAGSQLQGFAHLDAAGRISQRGAIERTLLEWTAQRAEADVVAVLTAAGVPVAPIANYQAMSGAGWRLRRGLTRDVDHPCIGRQEVVVPPWLFAGKSAGVARPAPLLGADTDAVLAALDKADAGPAAAHAAATL